MRALGMWFVAFEWGRRRIHARRGHSELRLLDVHAGFTVAIRRGCGLLKAEYWGDHFRARSDPQVVRGASSGPVPARPTRLPFSVANSRRIMCGHIDRSNSCGE